MNLASSLRTAAAAATLAFAGTAAHAAVVVTIGAVTGTGTVVVANNAQNTPLSWNFDTAFSFSNTPLPQLGGFSLQQIFGDVGQYRFQANSSGVNAVDGNGIGGPTLQQPGFEAWHILNTVPGNQNSTYFGSAFSFAFTPDALNSPTGSLDGDLTSDGFTHWYYGYDSDTCFDPPGPANCTNGRTPLLNSMFDFTGRYQLTGFTINTDGTRTLQVSLTGTVTQTIPEPGSLALVGAALLGGAALTRRRKLLAR
jgi:hypothetical protein